MTYLHLDVFTGEKLLGNQLAVFPDASGIDAGLMQRIALEMNFSESTFIMPAEQSGTDIRMRIFTPGSELPMAGHPTIGSTFALAHTGVIAPGTRASCSASTSDRCRSIWSGAAALFVSRG